ncbi:MAG: EipB family protein [Geminicoccaceae bacterium]
MISVLAALVTWAFLAACGQQSSVEDGAHQGPVHGPAVQAPPVQRPPVQRPPYVYGGVDRRYLGPQTVTQRPRVPRGARRDRNTSRRSERGSDLMAHRGDYVVEVSGYTTERFIDAQGTLTMDLINDCNDWTLQEKVDVSLKDQEKQPHRISLLYRVSEKTSSNRFTFAYSRAHLLEREDFIGDAIPIQEGYLASFQEPRTADLVLPGGTIYPITLRRQMIAAAKRGRSGFQTIVFDGAIDIVYLADASIGRPVGDDDNNPRVADTRAMLSRKTSDRLPVGRTWPVTVRFFPYGDEYAPPVLVREFLLHESGIIVGLHFDLGDLQVNASLANLDIFDPDGCSSPTRR